MNKTAIKNFAIWARVQLIEAAKQRAFEYEITENGESKANIESIGGRLLSSDEKKQRQQLIEQIHSKGYSQVMEEAAYTWFNRFIALRFMEVNGYLPSKIRVFTDENGAFKPEVLKEAMTVEIDGLDRTKVLDLLDKQNNEELYKYLLITQCNALNEGLPYMFEKISNWTELLFPANLLRPDSVVGQMVSEIPEEDWQDAVQIIGWMYQYYNSELKDDTFALLKKNVKITKERIPAATQLFTPDWIVRYMVENSLGRLWYEGHPSFDKSEWKYYLDEAPQEPEVELQLKKIRADYASINPEDIKVIDPCMGSGHILVYAFDVLLQIYTSCGWSERDAAKSIIENNLYGLDIDDRAGQLAYFAVMMKARKYNRRILNGAVKPNVLAIQDSGFMTDDFIAYVAEKDTRMKADLTLLRSSLKDAKEYGSILHMPKLNFAALYERIDIISRSFAEDMFQISYQNTAVEQLLPLVKQAEIMAQKYDVVVTNPPYMGGSGMSNKLADFVKKNYPDSKSDLFAVFIEKGNIMVRPGGYNCMVTMQSWMFLSSFETMRQKIVSSTTITNLMHMENMVMGIAFGTAVTVFRNLLCGEYIGTYNHITMADIEDGKPREFPVRGNRFAQVSTANFSKIPGSPVAYWVSDAMTSAFNNKKLSEILSPKQGTSTGNNDLFLRLWHEVSVNKISTCHTKASNTFEQKWYPATKGGDYRKWYGNNEYIVNWQYNGLEIKNYSGSAVRNPKANFHEALTWTGISSKTLGIRYCPEGFVFLISGKGIVGDSSLLKYVLGVCCSNVANELLKITSPTMSFEVGYIAGIPIAYGTIDIQTQVINLVNDNIFLSRKDWDSYETSWDFERNPLVNGNRLAAAYAAWKQECEDRFQQLKKNEEELNRIFIDIYGLQDELTPDVADKDVTVHRVFDSKDDVPESMKGSNYVRTMRDEIVSLISYAVGCMFGRYSLDVDGLAYAGGEWDESRYKTIVPDSDNIIPICDDEYFDDDITGRFVEFVRKVYGDDTLEENLKFVADALGGKGTAREVIRNYLLNGFYADHLKTYQKRPIYWLFSSGKKNGFKALIYMHRYQPDLLARMRTDYVHEQQERYRTQIQMLEDSTQTAAPSERVKLNKQITKLKDQALEIQKYEEKIHHLADQMISIDLDDGVKVNYAKFQDVLEKIK